MTGWMSKSVRVVIYWFIVMAAAGVVISHLSTIACLLRRRN